MKHPESRPGFLRRVYDRAFGTVAGLPPDLYQEYQKIKEPHGQVEGEEMEPSRKPGERFLEWRRKALGYWGLEE